MDWQLGGSTPFTYIVGEHARAVIAIQDLQKEVSTLLSFRDNVLDAIPHLRARVAPATPHEGPPGETSTHPAPTSGVVDSGFSTDKASTSMGKSSSSSSAGELSGSARWGSGEAEARLGATYSEDELTQSGSPIGSAEDELWQLLEVIQRKGSRLRTELHKAEMQEREIVNHSVPRDRHPLIDSWPHSLPPPPTSQRLDSYSLETLGELERLRWDRSYLVSRVSRAETEAAVSHSRLVDLHTQLIGLATEKRRLEEVFHAYGPDIIKSEAGPNRVHIEGTHPSRLGRSRSNSSVTVNVNSDSSPHHLLRHMAWREEEVTLPRVLKVPIRDKGTDRHSPRHRDNTNSDSKDSSKSADSTANHKQTPPSFNGSSSPLRSNPDRIVIERQRTCNKVDGGLSMPASLFKGAKIKVVPDKQRISAILREKDVLALQKQLLTTVMETEVLKRQMECCNEEWTTKTNQLEHDQKKNVDYISSLTQQNKVLKQKLDSVQNVPKCDVGVLVKPFMKSVGVSTEPEEENPTFVVHDGPNVKYDVVVHQETPRVGRAIEKPPRKRSQPPRMGVSGVDSISKDSLVSPRLIKNSSKTSFHPTGRATPSTTPRSSPASSLTSRSNRPSFASVSKRDPLNRSVATATPNATSRTTSAHKVPVVIPHFRASTSIPSLTTNRGPSLSPDSLSPVYTRIKRRAPISPSSIDSKSEMIESRNAVKQDRSLSASHFIRNTNSVLSTNRYLPKPPTPYGQRQAPSKLLKYFPIDKSHYGMTGSYLPVSITQKYLSSQNTRHYPKVGVDSDGGVSSSDSARYTSVELKEEDYKVFERSSTYEVNSNGEELDRSYSSADEHNTVKSTDAKHKSLWRKSSGAVRLRTVGRPSVLSLVNTDV